MNEKSSYRSLFWPIVLIGAGALWLLSNLGLLPSWSWGSLWRLWPLALIAVGLDMLVARRSAILGAILALAVIGLLVVAIVLGSNLNLNLGPRTAVQHDMLREPLDGALSAALEVDFSVGRGSLQALAGEGNLFTADIAHLGQLNYDVSGEETRSIRLSESNLEPSFSRPFDSIGDELYWDIRFSPQVPVDLLLHGGVGETNVDLHGMQPLSLTIDGGVGKVKLVLPATSERYPVVIDGDVGEIQIEIEDGAQVDLDITGGVGEVTINVPSEAAVEIDASISVGNVRVPSGYRMMSGGDEFIGESGVWTSPGFDGGVADISIKFDGGVGSLRVR